MHVVFDIDISHSDAKVWIGIHISCFWLW